MFRKYNEYTDGCSQVSKISTHLLLHSVLRKQTNPFTDDIEAKTQTFFENMYTRERRKRLNDCPWARRQTFGGNDDL